MSDARQPLPAPPPADGPAPLGGWPRLYLLVAALALLVMAVLWALTATFNIGKIT